jgi:hypothetical protein
MSWGGPGFVILIIAISTIGWVLTTAIRAKHGYPVRDDWGGTVRRDEVDAGRAAELMAQENERLKGQVGRLEERIAVLERIATDPAERTAREIDKLR